MNFNEFKTRVQGLPVILTRELIRGRPDRQIIRNQIERWGKKGLVIQLKRGIYMLSKADRKIEPSKPYIANQLYSPSYVSLEYALGYYGLIPEKVHDVTSISTKKTITMTSEIGTFIYQHVKPAAFRGFTAVRDDQGLASFIAEPEKAVVDFVYLNLERFKPGDRAIFAESYRFQNTEDLKPEKLKRYAGLFNSKKLMRVIDGLAAIIAAGEAA